MSEKIEIQIESYIDDDGNIAYDFEAMAEMFEYELSKLDDSVIVMCSVEENTKELNKLLKEI